MKVGIIGTGSVGTALAKGLVRAKHEVRLGSRDGSRAKVPAGTVAGTQKDVAAWADAVVLAIPFSAVKETVDRIGPALKGKVVVDVTNAIGSGGVLAVGHTTSGAEELAKLAPGSRVVKALNTVFAANMATGKIGTEPLSLFVAGDDAEAKGAVLRFGRDLGFDAVDAGPLSSARYLEPLAIQLMQFGFRQGMGTAIGFRLVRAK